MSATATAEAPAKARKPRKKSPYILQIDMETDGWQDFHESDGMEFKDDASARKFVRDGQHVGRFRVIRVVSEFTSAIEERKVVKLT